jgi:UDP-GlcNAc:undecaprenyl-phosphate GlcNAc-1-phosphate transferase
MQLYLACLLVSAVVSCLLTWGVRHFARRYALTRPPELSRHIHRSPIPRLGGLAIFASFMVVFLFYLVFADQGWMTGPTNGNIVRVLMIATGIFSIGVIDDLIGVPSLLKLAVEIVAGLGLYFSGIHFNFSATHLAGSYTSLVCVFVTVGWVVLICNAINLIDGVDGLAAGAALF